MLLARVLTETAKICVPTAIEGTLGLGGRMSVYDRRLADWSKRLVEAARIELVVKGREHLATNEAFVIMGNHQSHFDIVVLYRVLDRRVRMVAKKELYKLPIFARAMRAAGFVEVDRSNREQAVAALSGAKNAIASGTSIWIAPEGTRGTTGRLGPFKKGGFHLALAAEARILPVAISGTREILRPHDWKIQAGKTVHVTFEAPIDPREYGHERRAELMAAVRAAILRHLPEASG